MIFLYFTFTETVMYMELWKSITGYEGMYEVSNMGNIKSLARPHRRSDKMLTFGMNEKGYLIVGLHNHGQKTKTVHRIVAIEFVRNPHGHSDVNHLDGNKLNNNDWNLRWDTHQENIQHGHDTGLFNMARGGRNKFSKLTDEIVLQIREMHATGKYSRTELANLFSICHQNVGFIVRRKTWTHI